jgi:3-oxo-5-alpha-steroid 4-dehydrogenase 1
VSEAAFHARLLWTFAAFGVISFLALFFVTAPYGRHDNGRGPHINARLGWCLMEAPASIVVAICFAMGDRRDAMAWAFLLLWQLHYVYRAFVFPFRRRGSGTMPLSIAAGSFAFNLINGYLIGRALFRFDAVHASPWFAVGVVMFLLGEAINHHSDSVLFSLRKPGERGYRVPRGGLYRFVSCPNYFGEIVAWCGFAVLTRSPAAAVFAAWTIANLLPRARSHHRWYRDTFSDYPKERRALVPFVY